MNHIHHSPTQPDRRRSRSGVALLLVLGVIGLLAFIMTTLLEMTEQDFQYEIEQNRLFRAHQVAESGLAFGLHPQVQRGDPILRRETDDGVALQIDITSEQARLNINRLLTNEELTPILERLFTIWDIPRGDAVQLIARMQDWVDTDDLPNPGGAEADEYEEAGSPHRPANRPFRNLDEAATVLGIDILFEVRPDWQNLFTVHGNGTLNLNEADPDLIRALTGVSEIAVNAFLARRDGRDGEAGTDDDYVFTDPDEVRQALGMSMAAFETIAGLITLEGNLRRVTSTATVDRSSRSISLIANIGQSPPTFLVWEEK